MAKIGIMGGTFDPIHQGHLMLGRQAYREYSLYEVWFMPSANPPHKTDHRITDMQERAAMVRLALQGEQGLSCSDFEINRDGTTYTVQTLKLLKEEHPDDQFYFIIGADSLFSIEKWYLPQEIMKQCILLVAERNCEEAHTSLEDQICMLKEKYQADIRLLHCEEVDVSSEELRRLISQRNPKAWKYIKKEVKEYILEHNLYVGGF